MKRRLLALLMSLVMILSVLPGAAFAEPADSSDVLTYADLADIDSSITIPDGASASEELSVADAVRALLLWTGMSEKQLGTFPADYLALARSMGMISADTDTDAACTLDAYRQMKAVANTMYDALHADKLQPLYMNGMAQPIFPYTTGSVETGYSNADSDVIRYCVYVETNYDTDDDGKLDLVKAVVQVPRAAVEGNYKAATIYEARPYITGCNDSMSPGENLGSESYDISKLYSQPARRWANRLRLHRRAVNIRRSALISHAGQQSPGRQRNHRAGRRERKQRRLVLLEPLRGHVRLRRP